MKSKAFPFRSPSGNISNKEHNSSKRGTAMAAKESSRKAESAEKTKGTAASKVKPAKGTAAAAKPAKAATK
ncbi:MAG: hypothetical protein M3116_05070, partial [Actinomycetota bacterium]|nr:hypothetical protein [Actinomycetota bacterium]